jgi:ABC-2 type transport system ATP-binding protein
VNTVERVDENHYRLQLTGERDPTEPLVARAVRDNWGLFHLAPAQTSLEDVFENLTK